MYFYKSKSASSIQKQRARFMVREGLLSTKDGESIKRVNNCNFHLTFTNHSNKFEFWLNCIKLTMLPTKAYTRKRKVNSAKKLSPMDIESSAS